MTRRRSLGRRGAPPEGPIVVDAAAVAALRDQGLLSRVQTLPPPPPEGLVTAVPAAAAVIPPGPAVPPPRRHVPSPAPADLDDPEGLDDLDDLDVTVLRPRSYELVLPDGEAVPVDRDGVVVGRRPRHAAPPPGVSTTADVAATAPAAALTTAPAPPASITVTDETRQLSRAHFRVWADDAGAVVIDDLHSANGTTLLRPDGGPVTVEPGVGVQLTPADTIVVGDHRFTLRRSRPAP
ncbi:FHA domain-containing protein [Frigoribacterium sp. CFBP 13707]|uniref:FHA domain-containing protein n=1 Tax=Frigoribacterium sp. CFBP 13707 TaxID=2775313 RepID=UPI00177B1884|nr:FHA domain-containing protein [Frigoribacterium sp. CFBP 13707]MBD8729495.1 FHA domain-containing protein [Frigoribacterium sp. CFBP 13707]